MGLLFQTVSDGRGFDDSLLADVIETLHDVDETDIADKSAKTLVMRSD